jgi:hypothetical protein
MDFEKPTAFTVSNELTDIMSHSQAVFDQGLRVRGLNQSPRPTQSESFALSQPTGQALELAGARV